MRKVYQSDWIWKRGGVPATEIGDLVDCAYEDGRHPLALYAQKVYMLAGGLKLKKQYLAQGTQEWLEWRKNAVTATAAAATVGAHFVSKWGDRRAQDVKELWTEKVSRKEADQPENEAMKWGKDNEKHARRLYEELFDWPVPDVCVLHDQYDHVRASLDGLRADDDLVVEIKCCGRANHAKLLAISNLEDPLERQSQFSRDFYYYRYQVLYQLLITGARCCHFVGYNPKDFTGHEQLAVIELYPEPAEQEKLLKRVNEFWDFVVRREQPPESWCQPCWSHPTEIAVPDLTLAG